MRYLRDLYENWFNPYNNVRLNSRVEEDEIILNVELCNEIIFEKGISGKWVLDKFYDTTEFKLLNNEKSYKHQELLNFISDANDERECQYNLSKSEIIQCNRYQLIFISGSNKYIIPLNENNRSKVMVDLLKFADIIKKYMMQQLRSIKGGMVKVDQLYKILDNN